MYVYVADRC